MSLLMYVSDWKNYGNRTRWVPKRNYEHKSYAIENVLWNTTALSCRTNLLPAFEFTRTFRLWSGLITDEAAKISPARVRRYFCFCNCQNLVIDRAS